MSMTAVSQLQLVSIGKRYSGTKALDDVSVEVAGGTVHALVGQLTGTAAPARPLAM